MTDNRTTELLPCPTCGKKVHIGLYGGEPDYWWMVHGGMHYDECKCRLFMESCKFELEDETRVDYDEYAMNIRGGLVRRWNTRAELGSGTCRIEERNGDWYCDACGEMVGTCDPASELFIDGNAVELWNYCPSCGKRVSA